MGFPATDRGGFLGGVTLLRLDPISLLGLCPGWMGGQDSGPRSFGGWPIAFLKESSHGVAVLEKLQDRAGRAYQP